MNRILLEESEIENTATGVGPRAILDDYRAQHLRQVIGVKVGQQVRVGLVDGPLGMATVDRVSPERVALSLEFQLTTPDKPRVDLLLALPRPKVLGRLWAPLASLGVGHIALTNAWRVERNYFDTHWLGAEKYRSCLMEGLQQAGCTRLPTVSVHKRLVPLLRQDLARMDLGSTRLLAHPQGGVRIAEQVNSDPQSRVLLAVGPEGGWIERELALFTECNFAKVSASPRVLRTDVACSVLLGLIHDALSVPPCSA